MGYEYLMASLPVIFFEDPPPFKAAEFRGQCEGQLSARDYAAMERILAGEPPAAPDGRFEQTWHARETQLRNETALIRAARRGVDVQASLREHADYDVGLRDAVVDAYERPNPLERERELDRARWRVLDEWSAVEPFGRSAVLAYAAKLRIALRWAARTPEAGRERLESWMEGRNDA